MRMVQLPGFKQETSAVGFGCASLGSRISAGHGLRALEDAYAAGVNWFDLAPAYGAGEAETIFGRFLRGKRHDVLVCSKVGIGLPRRAGMVRLVYGIGRPLAGFLVGLRRAFRRVPATRNVAVPLTPRLVVESLESSLRALGTDCLDVYALHRPAESDVGRDELLRALEDIRHAGKARHIGVSGDVEAARMALRFPQTFSVIQVADDPEARPIERLREEMSSDFAIVTHSILGVGGSLERLSAAIRGATPALKECLLQAGYGADPTRAAARLLVDRALAVNAGGVVLLSMFSALHRSENLIRASGAPQPSAIDLVSCLLAGAGGPV
jgi:aryl-alcohol dehydrogenase-like predicted oxidoreductase